MQLENIEKEIETAIANDEIYAAAVPVPLSSATWLEFREYEVLYLQSSGEKISCYGWLL